MQWLDKVIDQIEKEKPEGEVVVSSGVSPSGTYHLGTLREVLTAEVIMRELKRRGREAKHIHVVDDLDVFRKVPADVPEKFSEYLGRPLCDVPSPGEDSQNYADYFLDDLLKAAEGLHLEMQVMRAHKEYREGFFTEAIEQALEKLPEIRNILEEVSGRKLGDQWSPVQVVEEGYLKNRQFISIDENKKEIAYLDKDNNERTVSYADGQVKLNWRIDWPARWSLLGVNAEPFGRDHATKGGSYDTGVEIVKEVYGASPPVPIPYNFINKTGDTKKMSKSAGDTVTAAELLDVLPAEVVWFFILRYAPDKLLFFDTHATLMKLFDEFSQLLSKPDKTKDEIHLIELCLHGVEKPTVSRIPFSHLVASYQASLRDPHKTIDVIARTEHAQTVKEDKEVIINELKFIDAWLDKWAPADVKFDLIEKVDSSEFSDQQQQFMSELADKISEAPENADGDWFHKAIYEFKEKDNIPPKELFQTLYKAIIGQSHGPRAGWFLSILPRDWLVKRLKLET